MTPNENYVRFRDVEKTYDGHSLVVERLNLDIRKGEFLSLLGPSGSGKTTTLMMLAGFETPTSGQILIDDKAIDALPPHKRDIGVVFQNYALFPHMTIGENVAFPLKMRKVSKAEVARRVAKALDMVKMGTFAERKPAQLSGGQQQRIALARALVFEPKIVLMDEPLGALDKQLREHMQLEIRHLHGNLGITVVYVTHDQGEALTMSDRVAVFHEGRVQQLAPPDELYERPSNAFVAQFIGDNNGLEGQVTHLDEKSCRVDVAGHSVKAVPGPGVSLGKPVTLCLRPERIHLGPVTPHDNMATARVTEVIYLGDHRRLRVDAFGRGDLMIKVPGSMPANDIAVGQEIPIGWAERDCRALKIR